MLMVMLGYVKRRKKNDGFVEQIHDWQKKTNKKIMEEEKKKEN